MARRRIWISGFDPNSLWIRTSGDTLNFSTKLVAESWFIHILKKKKKDNTLLHVENEVMFFEIKDFVAIYIERENTYSIK